MSIWNELAEQWSRVASKGHLDQFPDSCIHYIKILILGGVFVCLIACDQNSPAFKTDRSTVQLCSSLRQQCRAVLLQYAWRHLSIPEAETKGELRW